MQNLNTHNIPNYFGAPDRHTYNTQTVNIIAISPSTLSKTNINYRYYYKYTHC